MNNNVQFILIKYKILYPPIESVYSDYWVLDDNIVDSVELYRSKDGPDTHNFVYHVIQPIISAQILTVSCYLGYTDKVFSHFLPRHPKNNSKSY